MYNAYVIFLLTYYVISIFFCTHHIDRLSLRLAVGQLAQLKFTPLYTDVAEIVTGFSLAFGSYSSLYIIGIPN